MRRALSPAQRLSRAALPARAIPLSALLSAHASVARLSLHAHYAHGPVDRPRPAAGQAASLTQTVDVRAGVCPPPQPYCVTQRNYASPPTECVSDHECSGVDRCCYDTCLEHRVCKTADIAAAIGPPVPVPFDTRDLVRHAKSDILADDDASDVSGDSDDVSGRTARTSITADDEEHKSGRVKFV